MDHYSDMPEDLRQQMVEAILKKRLDYTPPDPVTMNNLVQHFAQHMAQQNN